MTSYLLNWTWNMSETGPWVQAYLPRVLTEITPHAQRDDVIVDDALEVAGLRIR